MPALHTDEQDAGRAGGLHQLARPHLCAAGRQHQGREQTAARRDLQRQQEDLPLHLLHTRRRHRAQPHWRRHRHLLRLRLEPRHGPTSHGQVSPYWSDAGRPHLPADQRAHHRGEHSAQAAAEAPARRRGGRPGQIHHRLHEQNGRQRRTRETGRHQRSVPDASAARPAAGRGGRCGRHQEACRGRQGGRGIREGPRTGGGRRGRHRTQERQDREGSRTGRVQTGVHDVSPRDGSSSSWHARRGE
mmetsp:Transcript_13434/g.38739  ORF Transcript_13434/g.38739 Transcript_13434/m.38739 type:complete len:245 (-) Transcript_13434:1058-1792(-)